MLTIFPSTDFSNEVHDHTVKDHPSSFGTEQNRSLSLVRPRSACLKPREEHQPHAGGGPLSRDSQCRRTAGFVNRICKKKCAASKRTASEPTRDSHSLTLIRPLRDYVSYIRERRSIPVHLCCFTASNCADPLGCSLRPNIILPDKEHDVLNVLERVCEH